MEEKIEPHFTVAVLLEALKSYRVALEDSGNMIVQYSHEIVRAHNKGDKTENFLGWMEMEVRNRERIYQRIRRVEAAIRLLNHFTKPYRD